MVHCTLMVLLFRAVVFPPRIVRLHGSSRRVRTGVSVHGALYSDVRATSTGQNAACHCALFTPALMFSPEK